MRHGKSKHSHTDVDELSTNQVELLRGDNRPSKYGCISNKLGINF